MWGARLRFSVHVAVASVVGLAVVGGAAKAGGVDQGSQCAEQWSAALRREESGQILSHLGWRASRRSATGTMKGGLYGQDPIQPRQVVV